MAQWRNYWGYQVYPAYPSSGYPGYRSYRAYPAYPSNPYYYGQKTATIVPNPTNEPPGTIVIDTGSRYLYLGRAGGKAIRYGIGVGRQGFGWKGVAHVGRKSEWPRWIPPKEMLMRRPDLPEEMDLAKYLSNPTYSRSDWKLSGSPQGMEAGGRTGTRYRFV